MENKTKVYSNAFNGKTLLITGGTGSFGNAVLKHFMNGEIGQIRIFSRDEKKQDDMRHDIQQKYPAAEVRVAVPGHTQRGGNPDAYDRVLSSRFGAKAAELFKEKDFGKLVVFKNNEVTAIPMEESAGKLKYVEPDNQLIQEAKTLGISFGD